MCAASAGAACTDSLFSQGDSLAEEPAVVPVEKGRVPRFLYSVGGAAGINHLLNIEMRGEKLVKRGWGSNYGLFVNSQANPLDSTISVWDRVFGFPALEAGVQLLDYSHTRLHTGDTPYMSSLGYIWVGYIAFRRDVYRNRRWSFGYALENGLTLCSRTYEADSNVDNDMIGQHLSMYFGFGLYAGYRPMPRMELSVGMEYKHVSNGATDRPNKGSNSYGLTVRGRYDLNRPDSDKGLTFEQRLLRLQRVPRGPFEEFMYLDVNASVGFRTLYDEWLMRRDGFLDPDDPDYNRGDLGLHTVWSAGLVPMFRYSQVHASGLGLEYTFAGYTPRSAMLERKMKLSRTYHHSKHILGIAGHHEVFYKQLSLAMSVGTYLFRQHGWVQKYEVPVYETVGIRYYPKFFRPFYVGYNVKANLGKAYAMELKVGIHAGHWRLKRK